MLPDMNSSPSLTAGDIDAATKLSGLPLEQKTLPLPPISTSLLPPQFSSADFARTAGSALGEQIESVDNTSKTSSQTTFMSVSSTTPGFPFQFSSPTVTGNTDTKRGSTAHTFNQRLMTSLPFPSMTSDAHLSDMSSRYSAFTSFHPAFGTMTKSDDSTSTISKQLTLPGLQLGQRSAFLEGVTNQTSMYPPAFFGSGLADVSLTPGMPPVCKFIEFYLLNKKSFVS